MGNDHLRHEISDPGNLDPTPPSYYPGIPAAQPTPPTTPKPIEPTQSYSIGHLLKVREQFLRQCGAPRFPVLTPIRGEAPWRRYKMEKPSAVIGRASDADVVLIDSKISRYHARILWENHGRANEFPRCVLEDCRSHNGTYLNRRRIQREYLSDGDLILCANTLLGFYIKDNLEIDYENDLLSRATTDSLTGLLNRVAFEEEAIRAFALAQSHNRPLSVGLIDVDRFKDINDTYGHATGDAVLLHLATLIITSMRASDIPGRFGGDEFAILLPETSLREARAALQDLRTLIERHEFSVFENSLHITASIGLASVRPEVAQWPSLLEEADSFLLKAKAAGSNQVLSSLSQ